MRICADLEVDLYNHVLHIAEQPSPDKYRAVCLHLIYILTLFKIRYGCTEYDLEILTNCIVLINNLVFHPKPDSYGEALKVTHQEEQKKVTDILLTIM